MAEDLYPLYPTAIIVPILAFPSWILCIPPIYWHFTQRNVAAGSLILWLSMLNFFTAVNALIWPRDNVLDWWDGQVLCDIEARIQVGAVVALTACTAVVVRKLAKVMDTRNITVVPSQRSRIREKMLEIALCWVYPVVMMALYYIVQPVRYFVFGISGCVAAYDSSWPSIVIIWMWGPLTTLAAAFYAGLLIFRLYRYRREFGRLISVRNTTKSRFMRLFVMAILVIALFLPYSLYILYQLASTVDSEYDWDRVHGPDWKSIIKVPTKGQVRWDRWGQIASGYLLFLLFGTGTDAYNTYKRMLCAIGLGKIFPSLYIMHESGASTSSSLTFAKGWASTWSTKAKRFFQRGSSATDSSSGSSQNASIVLEASTTNHSGTLQLISTSEPILPHIPTQEVGISNMSFFGRLFGRRDLPQVLPMYFRGPVEQMTPYVKSSVEFSSPVIQARAWASDSATPETFSENDGVHILYEVHQAHEGKSKEQRTDPGSRV